MSRQFQPLNPQHAATIAGHARSLRNAPTASERALWALLSSGKLGVSFRRQFVIGRFIADFAAPSRRLVIEVDGGYHQERARADAARDAKLMHLGWRVLRIPAQVVMSSPSVAVAAVREAMAARR